MARVFLGEIEYFVLLALLRLGEPQYGVPVLEEIAARTGHRPSRAAIYIALQRLETKGLVTSWLAEPTAERGGRARRYFELQRPTRPFHWPRSESTASRRPIPQTRFRRTVKS